MIYHILQTVNGFNMEWVAGTNSGDILAEIAAPYVKGDFIVLIRGKEYNKSKEYKQKLYFNPKKEYKGQSLAERMTWRLYEDGEIIGTICQKAVKVKGLFQTYVYDEFQYKGTTYKCYEVGLGRKGIFLCIYKDNELVAMVDKVLRVEDYLDHYKCYLLNEDEWEAIIPYVIRYDCLKYNNMFERSVHSVQHHKLNTIQKEVLAKYVPTFIDRVKAMEGDA